MRSQMRSPGAGGLRLPAPLRKSPVRPNKVAGIAIRDALEVILMLGLGLPERTCWYDLCHDGPRPYFRGVHISNGLFCGHLLFGSGIEDRAAIAGPEIVALTIAGCRIVNLK